MFLSQIEITSVEVARRLYLAKCVEQKYSFSYQLCGMEWQTSYSWEHEGNLTPLDSCVTDATRLTHLSPLIRRASFCSGWVNTETPDWSKYREQVTVAFYISPFPPQALGTSWKWRQKDRKSQGSERTAMKQSHSWTHSSYGDKTYTNSTQSTLQCG